MSFVLRAWPLALSALVATAFAGCLRDFSQFDASREGTDDGGITGGQQGFSGSRNDDGDGGTDGTDGAGTGGTDGAGTDGAGGTGGAGTGGAGTDEVCPSGQKLCNDDCVPDDNPATGCAEPSCSACRSQPFALMGCEEGQCAVIGCQDGYRNCGQGVGCPHSASTFNETACGGCDADCTTLGLRGCSTARCVCTQAEQCRWNNPNNGTYECTSGLCACGGTTCNPGESCSRQGSGAQCTCGGGAACSSGSICCPGSDGASCKDLSGDSSNCGACGWQCPDGQTCVEGTCQ